MIGDNSAVVTEEVVAVSNRHLVKFVFLRWTLSSSGELSPIIGLWLMVNSLWSPSCSVSLSTCNDFFKAETNCKVGQVAALPARGKQWWSWHNGAFPPFLFSNSPCWNKLVVSLHLWQFCILEFCPKSCTFSIHLDVLLYGDWFQKEGFWKERQETWEEPIWWCLREAVKTT